MLNRQFVRLATFAAAFAVVSTGSAPTASAATVFNLNCILENGISCDPSVSYGTVTVSQVGPVADGTVSVTVDLVGTVHKFIDLVLNYSSAVTITDNDGTQNIVYSSNTFQIQPYDGFFDVGVVGGNGWDGDDGYSVTLSGGLTELGFQTLDTGNLLYAALHIQNINCPTSGCVAGQGGQGSLKVGATGFSDGFTPIPEPASILLFGAGAAGLARAARKRFARS